MTIMFLNALGCHVILTWNMSLSSATTPNLETLARKATCHVCECVYYRNEWDYSKQKNLKIYLLEGYGWGLRLFEGHRQSATNIMKSPNNSPESRVATANTVYDPQIGNPRSSIK